MKKSAWRKLGASARIALGFPLLLACTSELDQSRGVPTAGPGATPEASGTTAASGVGTNGVGGSSSAASSVGGSSGSGVSTSGAGTTTVAVEPPPFEPAPGTLRRLTRAQFYNAVHDVFGFEVDIRDLDPDNWTGDFAVIGAASVVTSERGVEQYHTAIENAVNDVFLDDSRRASFIGCEPSAAVGDVCVRGYVESMGRRAWRRPLDSSEVDRVVAVADDATSELGSASEGLRWATVTLFTSPNFLYRPELGAPTADGSLRFTSYEIASRLAFLIWNSVPDDALLDAAADGTLDTVDGIRAQAERMLDAAAGRAAVGEFAEQYMRLDRVLTQAKDAGLFPEYGPALQAGMVRDMRGTWEALAFDQQTSALDLFSTTTVVANAELASLYGLDATGLGSDTFQTLSLPADGPRLGILGKAGFLSQFANQKEGSPTLRGKFMSEAFLCRPISPPPGNVNVALGEPSDAAVTKRDRLEQHSTDPACASCHAFMDPLAYPLESFDAIGRYRTTEQGVPIDPSGEFDGQPVADARELGLAVAQNPTVATCMVRKYYAYAVGHEERDVDGSVLNSLAASFQASGYQLRQLVLDVVSHEAFASVAPEL